MKALTFEDIQKRKWETVEHEFCTGVKITRLQGFNGATNINHHSIRIVSDKVPEFRGSSRKVSRKTIILEYNAFGESGEEVVLPIGTGVKEAKQKALQLVKKLIEEHGAVFAV